MLMDTSTPNAATLTAPAPVPVAAPPLASTVAVPAPPGVLTPAPVSPLQQAELPKPTTDVAPAKPARAPKHFLAAFFLSFFLGIFGADRYYLGYYGQGTLKLLTLGYFGIGTIIDLGIIMGGGMRTAKGEPLVGYEEYKGLAKDTIKWLTIGAVVALVFVGISIAVSINVLMSSGLGNIISSGLSAESGGALTLPGSSPNASTQQYKDLLKQIQ